MEDPKTVTLLEAAKGTFTAFNDVGIIDDYGYLFERNPGLEAFTESLATESTKLAEGVEWHDLNDVDGIDADSTNFKGLLTRKDSRGIIGAWFMHAEKHARHKWPSMAFIIGSPGIGKTRTLTYALRVLLQYENVNVQYICQKTGTTHLFLRRSGTTYTYSSPTYAEKATGTLFYRNSATEDKSLHTYILLDPSEEGASFKHPVMSHLLVSCSANIKHYHNITKESGATKLFLGLPSIAEVEVMAKKLVPELDTKILLKRISDVGTVPRYLFGGEEEFELRRKEISTKGTNEAAGSNSNIINENLVLSALTNGNVVSDAPSLCGDLFAHVNVESTDDDDGVDYKQQRVSVLSQFAAWLLYKRFRSAFVQAILQGDDCDRTAVFEKLCAFDLIVGGKFRVANMKSTGSVANVKNFKPAASVIRVMPRRNEKETRDLFVRPALKGISSITADYEVSQSQACLYEPPAKKQKLGPPFIVLSDGFSSIDF